MITSHRDRRAFQNYHYFSRSSPIRHWKLRFRRAAYAVVNSRDSPPAPAPLAASPSRAGPCRSRCGPGAVAVGIVFRGRHGKGPGLTTGALWSASVGAAAIGAGPDQREALAVLVVEEVGVDRGGEARISASTFSFSPTRRSSRTGSCSHPPSSCWKRSRRTCHGLVPLLELLPVSRPALC